MPLSQQEQQVLELIEESHTYRDMAELLNVHPGTIARVVYRIREKGYILTKGVNYNSTRHASFSFREY